MPPHRTSNIGLNQFNPKLFPWSAFDPVMAGAIHDISVRTQAPIPLIASSVLSACALTCQRRYEVRLPFGGTSPLSLFMLLFANSGERKSAVDSLVYNLIRRLEREYRVEFLRQRQNYRQKLALWSAVNKALQKKLLRVDGERLLELQAKLEDHHAHKPVEPVEIRFILDDATPAAIVSSLRKSPSASLISKDGRTMLLGRALSDVSLLNQAWERATLHVDRAGADTVVLDDYELSMWIMAQPGVLDEFMKSDRGRVCRDTGLLARCLIACPGSTQGHRHFDPAAFQPDAGLRKLHQRQEDVLRSTSTRQIIELDQAAIERYARFQNNLEQDLLPGQYLSDLPDFTSKAPENAVRIAAIFHVMSGRSGPLQVDHMQGACELTEWYLHEAKRLFGSPLISQEESDADTLAQWLHSCIRAPNTHVDVRKADIYHYGPNALRNQRRLNPALQVLESQGRVLQGRIGKQITYRYRPSSF